MKLNMIDLIPLLLINKIYLNQDEVLVGEVFKLAY